MERKPSQTADEKVAGQRRNHEVGRMCRRRERRLKYARRAAAGDVVGALVVQWSGGGMAVLAVAVSWNSWP